MAGYSGTPLAKKLGIKDGGRVLLIAAPEGFEKTLEGLPETAVVTGRAGREHDVIVLFAKDSKAFEKGFAGAKARLHQDGGLWIAWPKKSSGVKTDLTENAIRDVALAAGLVDNKVCAIDEVWSGLRVVVRARDRT
jgi:hypothetical protein